MTAISKIKFGILYVNNKRAGEAQKKQNEKEKENYDI